MEDTFKELNDKMNELLDLMHKRVEETTETKKLAEIIKIALSMSGGAYKSLIDGKLMPERVETAIKIYFKCIKIIVEANWKAHKMLNPNIEMPSVEEQYAEELEKEQNKKLQSLYSQYF
jgi:hypothetical protein